MTGRIWFAPAGTPVDLLDEWTELGGVADVQFTANTKPADDEPAWSSPVGRTFTAEVTAPTALWEALRASLEKSDRALMYQHALAGGPWRYGDTRPNMLDEWARGFIDGRRRGRGGP